MYRLNRVANVALENTKVKTMFETYPVNCVMDRTSMQILLPVLLFMILFMPVNSVPRVMKFMMTIVQSAMYVALATTKTKQVSRTLNAKRVPKISLLQTIKNLL